MSRSDRTPGSASVSTAGASGSHADLSGVTADQHHAKSHAHDGADGSGTIAHAATTGQGVNDHHPDHRVLGGKETVQAHGTTGSTETIDLTSGNVHSITLDAACTLTLTGATASTACTLTLIVTQNGTGGWALTWPAAVKWPGGVAPTISTGANKVSLYTLLTVDAGTTWLAFLAGDDIR